MVSQRHEMVGFAEFSDNLRIPFGLEAYFTKMATLKSNNEQSFCALVYRVDSEPRIPGHSRTIELDHVAIVSRPDSIEYLTQLVNERRKKRINQFLFSQVQYQEIDNINGVPVSEYINFDAFCSK